jgi:predicted GTPase
MVVEDGPTITHGGMPHGAGFVAAQAAGAGRIVDPRPFAAPAIAAVYARYPHIGPVLPAVGYGPEQIEALARTIREAGVDVVLAATPADLAALLPLPCPVVRVRYEFAEAGQPVLSRIIDRFLAGQQTSPRTGSGIL